MCKEDKCEGTGCNGNGCTGECNGHGEKEKDGLNRFIVTGYVCENCDTDFGMNEFGMNIRDGTYSVCCPVCRSPVLRVYHIVKHSDHPFPSITMCKEVLDYLIKDEEEERMFDYRVPNDGHHGVDNACVDQEDFLGELLALVKTCAQTDYETCMKNNFECKKCEDRVPVDRDELVKKVIGVLESVVLENIGFDRLDTPMCSSSITNFSSELTPDPLPSVSKIRENIRKLQKRHIGKCGSPGMNY